MNRDDMTDSRDNKENQSGSLLRTILVAIACFVVFSVLAEFGCAPRNLRS